MSNMNKERKFEIQISPPKSLANLEGTAPAQIIAAREINLAIEKSFDLQNFLEELNERFFEGKGEIKPFGENSRLIFHSPKVSNKTESSAVSKFKKYFSAEYESKSLSGGLSLFVKRGPKTMGFFKKLDSKGYEELPESLYLSVWHSVETESKEVNLSVYAGLDFTTTFSDFKSREVYLRYIDYGRSLKFPLDPLPRVDLIGKQLVQNTFEVMKELEAQGFISLKEEDQKDENSDR